MMQWRQLAAHSQCLTLCLLSIAVVTAIRIDDDLHGENEKVHRGAAQPNQDKTIAELIAETATATTDEANTMETDSGSSRWYKCTFDGGHKAIAHLADRDWAHYPGMTTEIQKFRDKKAIKFKPDATQKEVYGKMMSMLPSSAAAFDEINVNWYVGYGSLIGVLRSQTAIPWDWDIDYLVRVGDRMKIFDYIKNGPGAVTVEGAGPKGTNTSVYRLDPKNENFLMMAHKQGDNCNKALWIDLETGVPIDVCIDCGGDIEHYVHTTTSYLGETAVKVPVKAGKTLLPYDGIDVKQQTIPMDLKSKEPWTCIQYECSDERPKPPEPRALADYYKNHPGSTMGPYYFLADQNGMTAQCALPRELDKCKNIGPGTKKLQIRPCTNAVSLKAEND